jgi:hypothetical protein
MKLYKLLFRHYSQKDSQEGTTGYIVAESDDEVYEALAYNAGWKDQETYDAEEDGLIEVYDEEVSEYKRVSVKQNILDHRGDFHKECDLTDLYYGATLRGWEEGVEITSEEVDTLRKFGILEAEEP